MSKRLTEENIVHENGDYWVLQDGEGKPHFVMTGIKGGGSKSESAYKGDADGLSIAKARCDYLAKRKLGSK